MDCKLAELLSDVFESEIIEIKESSDDEYENDFSCTLTIRAKLKSELDAQEWLRQFKERTSTDWIVCSKREPRDGKFAKYHYNKDFVCHHSKLNKLSTSKKNKNCLASLSIRVKKDTVDVRKRDEYVRRGLCGIIELDNRHKHFVINAEALSWLRRREDIRLTFLEYFNSGHSPSVARHLREDMLEAQDILSLADSSLNPPVRWVYRLHDQWRKGRFGDATQTVNFMEFLELDDLPDDSGSLSHPTKQLQFKFYFKAKETMINNDFKAARVAKKRISDLTAAGFRCSLQEEPFVFSVVSPLMQRVLLSDSQAISVFIDTSGSCDQVNTNLTVVTVSSKAGALPIGFALHGSQDTNSYTSVFRLLKQLWVEIAPGFKIENFMTDNSSAMKNSLHVVWPEVPQYLCLFHTMQSMWRWLCETKHGICKSKRQNYMQLFSQIVYAKTVEEAEEQYACFLELLDDDDDRLTMYLNTIWESRAEWCLSHRTCITRGHNTNNYAEATFRLIKDVILCRLKAYNALALLDYMSNVMETYYRKRLLAVAFGRRREMDSLQAKIQKLAKSITLDSAGVQETSQNIYLVKSASDEDTSYEVDGSIGRCSCFIGRNGAYCKHQAAVEIAFKVTFPYSPKVEAVDKRKLFIIAEGLQSPKTFLRGMTEMKEPLSVDPDATAGAGVDGTGIDMYENQSAVSEPIMQTDDIVSSSDVQHVSTSSSEELLNTLIHQVHNVFSQHLGDAGVGRGMKTMISKLSKINTAAQLTDYVFGHQRQWLGRRRCKIPVQPTAIARRAEGMSRGSARRRAGRPLAMVAAKRRRALQHPRNLSQAVHLNRPNAKSHGDGH